MNIEIPVVKDLAKCELVDDAIKYIIEEIKTQFAANVLRSTSDYYIELGLDPNHNSKLYRYTCTVYVQTADRYSYIRERDEGTGDIYTIHNGINIELNWPSFGNTDVDLCNQVLKLYTKVNDACTLLKMAYAHKLVRLSQTREQEIEHDNIRKLEYNKRNVIAAITPHINNMRISSKFRTTSVANGPSIDEGDYEVVINNKKFFCNVSGLEVTFSRMA